MTARLRRRAELGRVADYARHRAELGRVADYARHPVTVRTAAGETRTLAPKVAR